MTSPTPSETVERPRRLPPEVRRSLARVKDGTASETDLQRVVIQYAKDHGWMVDHRGRARVKEGRWVTPVWGHPGYPDLTLTRGNRIVWMELKAQDGSVAPTQRVWLDRLEGAGGEVYVYRPRDWPAIRRTLR